MSRPEPDASAGWRSSSSSGRRLEAEADGEDPDGEEEA